MSYVQGSVSSGLVITQLSFAQLFEHGSPTQIELIFIEFNISFDQHLTRKAMYNFKCKMKEREYKSSLIFARLNFCDFTKTAKL